jgi:hypothetical protein
MAYTPHFGDLPAAGQALLTRTFDLDFSMSDFKAPRWFSAWAYDEDDSFAGIFAIEFKYWFDGYVTILVLDQRCMSRRVLRAIFTAAFSQARRLTAEVEPHNRRALKQVQRLGFQYTGYRRLGIEGTRDVMVFDMLKNECRYLPGYVRPASPSPNIPDSIVGDAETAREFSTGFFGSADFPHLRERQLGSRRPDMHPVSNLVSNVFSTSGPAQMPPVNAGALPTLMSRIHTAGRR